MGQRTTRRTVDRDDAAHENALHQNAPHNGATAHDIPDAVRDDLGFTYAPDDVDGTAAVPLHAPLPLTPSWWVLRGVWLYRHSYLHDYRHRHGCPCLFVPTCSEYIERAVVKHGVVRGLAMGMDRVRRCSPQHQGPLVDYP